LDSIPLTKWPLSAYDIVKTFEYRLFSRLLANSNAELSHKTESSPKRLKMEDTGTLQSTPLHWKQWLPYSSHLHVPDLTLVFILCFCVLCSWLETNTPHYYSECARVLGPLMDQGLEKTKTAAIFISENTTQFILWIKEKTPQAIEWVRLWTGASPMVVYISVAFHLADLRLSLCLCPGEHQHSRQCLPGVGVFKGPAPLPPAELHLAGAGVFIWTATTIVDQPPGLLQVSTLRRPLNMRFVSPFFWM